MKIRTALSFDDVLLVPNKFTGDSRKKIDISTNIGGLKLKIPIIAANMPAVCGTNMAIAMAQLGGLGIVHRMQSVKDQSAMVRRVKNEKLLVGAAVGIGEKWRVRAKSLIAANADIICIDVAHGHSDRVLEVTREFKKEWPSVPLIVGNVATFDAACDLSKAGADVIKVGVGGGSVCSTRIQTGCGVPTLESVYDISRTTEPNLIADGGIKNSGDIVKSLAAGASACMLGSLLAGTDESPGAVIKAPDGNKYKIYRGAASFGAKKEFFGKAEYIEGEETLVPYRGSVKKVIEKLCEGIRSGYSYCGATSLEDLQQTEFIQITAAGMKESKPHGLL